MFEQNESEKIELTPELAALERQLAGLDVAPLHVDRDRLMFEAGRAAGIAERELAATPRVAGVPRWFWPAAAAMMTAACFVLSTMLVWRGDAVSVAQSEAKPQAVGLAGNASRSGDGASELAPMAGIESLQREYTRPSGGYLETRYIALTRGVGELRSENDGEFSIPSGALRPAATARELLRELAPSHVAPKS
jgi:hypothetical protein